MLRREGCRAEMRERGGRREEWNTCWLTVLTFSSRKLLCQQTAQFPACTSDLVAWDNGCHSTKSPMRRLHPCLWPVVDTVRTADWPSWLIGGSLTSLLLEPSRRGQLTGSNVIGGGWGQTDLDQPSGQPRQEVWSQEVIYSFLSLRRYECPHTVTWLICAYVYSWFFFCVCVCVWQLCVCVLFRAQ